MRCRVAFTAVINGLQLGSTQRLFTSRASLPERARPSVLQPAGVTPVTPLTPPLSPQPGHINHVLNLQQICRGYRTPCDPHHWRACLKSDAAAWRRRVGDSRAWSLEPARMGPALDRRNPASALETRVRFYNFSCRNFTEQTEDSPSARPGPPPSSPLATFNVTIFLCVC
ncbi:hypothetical protein SKAU_G00012670 [Synaphobranchus kaupii]|uniref:Uncharacterized protein n=1 Tax=Synaphobranchus kaupii TaxID=118154 RepID=A0A9Q1JDN9_SYNKA|nr:hypothetical protein SKAU_G00012670 [Synaphobranchus kaupii]